MLTESDIETINHQAEEHLRSGDLGSAIQVQAQLVSQLMELGPKAVQARPDLTAHLERASSTLVDSYRWARQYAPAIALQEQLVAYLPAVEDALRLGAANLRVETDQKDAVEAGLEQIRQMAAGAPDNYWFEISLAGAYMYLERFPEAEKELRKATEMISVRKVDRALAYQQLFWLLSRFGRTEEALAAWREASRLDSRLRGEMLPDVCRMLIYWKKFPEARQHIAYETVQVRRQFFLGLLAAHEEKFDEAIGIWRRVMTGFDPAALKEGQDEFAETCLRMGQPAGVMVSLGKNTGQASFYRSMLLGLAYAQQGNLERARFYFEVAMRLGDLERPRHTMGFASGRVLGLFAGLLYSAVPVRPDVRKQIAGYFVPQGNVNTAEEKQ